MVIKTEHADMEGTALHLYLVAESHEEAVAEATAYAEGAFGTLLLPLIGGDNGEYLAVIGYEED